MKYIVISALIGAIWLLSANEQGLVGDWGYWTSLGITLLLAGLSVLPEQAGKIKNKKMPVPAATEDGQKIITSITL